MPLHVAYAPQVAEQLSASRAAATDAAVEAQRQVTDLQQRLSDLELRYSERIASLITQNAAS